MRRTEPPASLHPGRTRVGGRGHTGQVHIVVNSVAEGVVLTALSDEAESVDDGRHESRAIALAALPAEVARLERGRPRWVWDDTSRWYPAILAKGVRVERCVDLRLNHAILRNSTWTAASELARAQPGPWDSAAVPTAPPDGALFDLVEQHPPNLDADSLVEFRLQRAALAASTSPRAMGLLLAAESAGALIAAEMRFAGLPWSPTRHDQVLSELLGPRPRQGERPAKLDAVLMRIRAALDAPDLNPDSPQELLRALRRAGLIIASTRSWDLKKIDHPVIPPLLEYKKLARLLSANGWQWLDTWVVDGRFRPDYVPGGVVTGRWATSGGGALQLPHQIRAAVVADPGWKLVVADAAQLEPRILAGLSADLRMAEAGRTDLYEGIVASGAVSTRAEAKLALLGAMYGATTGESGRLLPRLARAFPRALALVETAARAGERGEVVSTRLGRSSPPPSASWREAQGEAYGVEATDADQSRARGQARSWGRFTRNFIVQGTAAEWALCWMAGLRKRLWEMADGAATERPHLVFFLHDEVVVHAPAAFAEGVADAVRAAAADAGRLLFGEFPVDFPITVAIVDSYAEAK